MVVHGDDDQQAAQIADRIIVVRDGLVVKEGNKEENGNEAVASSMA